MTAVDVVARLRAAGCVFAEDEAAVLAEAAAGDADTLDGYVARRVAGEPIEYIVGWAQFLGRRYAVEPGVFVPRHRSEALVRAALALCRPGAVVLDLCCGCGALGAALADRVDVDLHAADIDPAAVRCARRNTRAAVYEGDLFEPVPTVLRGRVDVLLVNAPYVPSAAVQLLPPEFRDHERRAALDGGPDGTAVQGRVLGEASRWLAPGGVLLTETGADQADRLMRMAHAAGLDPRLVVDEDAETTVLVATAATIS